MRENKDKELFEKIEDDQERIFFRLNLIKEGPVFFRNKLNKKFTDNPNLLIILNEYKILRTILIFISSFGFLIFFLFILIKANYIIVLTVLLISLIYIIFLWYLKKKYKAELNLTKKEYKIIIEERKIFDKSSTYQMIFNIIIIIFSLFLLISSFLKNNSLLFILVFMISLLYLLTE